MSEWISVKKEIPPPEDLVLMFSSQFGIEVGALLKDVWWTANYEEYFMERWDEITHWTKLPAPPKEEKDE
jgi:hypothetical protein